MEDHVAIAWREKNGIKEFQIRGFGKEYREICRYLETVRTEREWDDFPWFGFVFSDFRKEEPFMEKWEKYVYEDKE